MAVEEQDFNEIANNAKLEDLEPLNYLVGQDVRGELWRQQRLLRPPAFHEDQHDLD